MEKKLTAEAENLWKKKASDDWHDNGPEKPYWIHGCIKGMEYASQECSSKDEEIQKLKEEIKDLEERFDGVAETNVSAHEYAKKLIEQLESKDERIKELEEALGSVMQLIDSGVLVRDISKDHQSDWAIKSLKLVSVLQTAQKLLTPDTEKKDPRDNPLTSDDSWVHDVDMGNR